MKSLKILILLISFLVIILCILAFFYTNYFSSIFLTLLYFFILVSPILLMRGNNSFADPLVIYVIFNCTFGLQFVLPFILVDSQSVDTVRMFNSYNVRALVEKLLVLKIFSVSVFYFFLFIFQFNFVAEKHRFHPVKISWIAFFLIIQGFLAFLVIVFYAESILDLLNQRQLKRFDRIYHDIGRHWFVAVQLSLVGFYLLILESPKRSINPFFNLLFLLFVAMNFIISGNRTSIVLAYLGLYGAWMLAQKRLVNYRLLIVGFLFLILLLVGNLIRESGTTEVNGNRAGVFESLVGSLQSLVDLRVARVISGSGSLGVLAHLENGGAYLYGESFESVLFAPIPSSLIGEKPLAGGRMAAYVLADRLDTAWPIEPEVEQYWNFGYLGVILAAIIKATIFRWVYVLVRRQPHNVAVLLISLTVGTQLQIASDALYKVLQSLIPIFAIYLYIQIRSRSVRLE